MNGNQSTFSRALNDLRDLDIHGLTTTFVQSNLDRPLVQAVVTLLDRISTKADLQRLINQLMTTLTDSQFYNGLPLRRTLKPTHGKQPSLSSESF